MKGKNYFMRNNKKNNGYTLLELMMVVVIMGIVFALALPQISGLIRDSSREAATWNVIKAFNYARSNSLLRGESFGVFISTQNNGLIFVNRGSTNSCLSLPLNCLTTPPAPEAREFCHRYTVDFSTGDYAENRIIIKSINVNNTVSTDVNLCWNPRGRLFFLNGNVWVPVSIPIDITVVRLEPAGSNTVGVMRRIVVPQNGVPRILI